MTKTTTSQNPFSPDIGIPPGETLADLLEERGMTQTELSRRLGVSLKHVNQIVKGAASISAELALGLEKVFGVSADFWLNRESLYQANVARREAHKDLKKAVGWANRFPIVELKSRGFLTRTANGPALVAALLQFFGLATPKQWSDPTAAFRRSLKFASDPYALSAWLRVGELEASEIDCQPYDSDAFVDALVSVRAFTRLQPTEWHPRLVDICANAGVAVVIVDTFAGARVNGATRWLSPRKALVQLSLRYRWEDVFWFTFFHEAAHVLLHRKKDVFVETPRHPKSDQPDTEWARFENEADRFSARTLIPPHLDRQLRHLTISEVPGFAEQLDLAPAIVIGRLQHDGHIPHSQGNKLRRRLAFAHD